MKMKQHSGTKYSVLHAEISTSCVRATFNLYTLQRCSRVEFFEAVDAPDQQHGHGDAREEQRQHEDGDFLPPPLW